MGRLIKTCSDSLPRICVARPITKAIIAKAHGGLAGGHLSSTITLHKVLTALYWWPDLQKDVHNYCKKCNICQRNSSKPRKGKNPLHPVLSLEIFQS